MVLFCQTKLRIIFLISQTIGMPIYHVQFLFLFPKEVFKFQLGQLGEWRKTSQSYNSTCDRFSVKSKTVFFGQDGE